MKRTSQTRKGGIGSRAAPGRFVEPIRPADDVFEREAHRVADVVARGGFIGVGRPGWSAASSSDDTIRHKCVECEEQEEEQIRRAPSAAVAEDVPSLPAASERAAEPSVGPTLLVDDEGGSSRGQMRKTEFLTALRVEVCARRCRAQRGCSA
jgi:hypothetical protein